ncbi:MAG: hypothetical protein ACRYFS_24780 [Janthinobacterium lividum]
MNICTFAFLSLAAVSLAPPLHAQTPNSHAQLPSSRAPQPSSPPQMLHYRWTKGLTLRYLIQRDPYFADPKAAMETVSPETPYRSPIVERLTEKVLTVSANGAATLLVTLSTEPGFEDEDAPQPAISRTVRVSAAGQVLSVSGEALGSSPAERDLLRGFIPLPPASAVRADGLAVVTQEEPPAVTNSTSPDHDGTLLQTTQVAQSDHLVFDSRRGWIEREISTMTITLSLVMTGRGRRGSDDFGHVIPRLRVTQSLILEHQAD